MEAANSLIAELPPAAAGLQSPDLPSSATTPGRPAGDFLAWLGQTRRVLRGEGDADVPCDGCVGCCVSSYHVPLRPADTVALQRVPDHHLTWPRGGGLARMGFREDGSCPLLLERRCTIYAARPRTCRDYDCRIYAAAGSMPDGDRPVIQARVAEWAFTFDGDEARMRAAALRRAAHFIRSHAGSFPESLRAHSATAAAVMAVKVHELFDVPEDAGEQLTCDAEAIRHRVQQIQQALRAFDKKGPEGPLLQHPGRSA